MTLAQRVRLCQLLLAKANRTNFPAEADACRAKAQALMDKYGLLAADVMPPQAAPQPHVPVHTVIFTGAPIVVVITGSGTGTVSTATGSLMWGWSW